MLKFFSVILGLSFILAICYGVYVFFKSQFYVLRDVNYNIIEYIGRSVFVQSFISPIKGDCPFCYYKLKWYNQPGRGHGFLFSGERLCLKCYKRLRWRYYNLKDRSFLIKEYQLKNIDVQIDYVDSSQRFSRREVTLKSFGEFINDNHSLMTYCHLRKHPRTFKLSKIQRIVNMETGEKIKNITGFIKEIIVK